jgi:DNA-binding MarR family transcriptional regulator
MNTSALAVKQPATYAEPIDQIGPAYREMLTLVERLHRRLLDVIRDEFDQRGRLDVNPVQALLLYNVGDKALTVSELRIRGYYLGSNVSYNLKKLTEDGFPDHQRSRTDRRSVRISLTEKGRDARDIVAQVFARHLVSIADEGRMGSDDFAGLNRTLLRLERFWTDQIMYRL